MGSNLLGWAVGGGAVVSTALYQIWAGTKQKELQAGSMQARAPPSSARHCPESGAAPCLALASPCMAAQREPRRISTVAACLRAAPARPAADGAAAPRSCSTSTRRSRRACWRCWCRPSSRWAGGRESSYRMLDQPTAPPSHHCSPAHPGAGHRRDVEPDVQRGGPHQDSHYPHRRVPVLRRRDAAQEVPGHCNGHDGHRVVLAGAPPVPCFGCFTFITISRPSHALP